jgi:hypothetical protein
MTNQEKKTCDLIKSRYEEISRVLVLLEQRLLFECSSNESVEKDIGLICIRGYN